MSLALRPGGRLEKGQRESPGRREVPSRVKAEACLVENGDVRARWAGPRIPGKAFASQ